jgi:uncharacterized membrane protein
MYLNFMVVSFKKTSMFIALSSLSNFTIKKCLPENCQKNFHRIFVAAFALDMITGIALIIIGSLAISGIIPCNAIGVACITALGCLQFAAFLAGICCFCVASIGACCLFKILEK